MRKPTTWKAGRDPSRHLTPAQTRAAHRLLTMATALEATSAGSVRELATAAREGINRELLRAAGV